MTCTKVSATIGGAGLLLACASGVMAVPVEISWTDTPFCDPLLLPFVMHELGNPPAFPIDELISSTATFTDFSPCPPLDSPFMPNSLVVMTNLTGTFWTDVHYVADPETLLTNDDGLINGEFAFEIDAIGLNTPLVFESIAFDGIFAPGEIWHFVIQDYTNGFGLPASLFGSVGAVGMFSGGDMLSSGSIIAQEIPGPGGAALMALAFAIGPSRRRSHR